MQGASMHYVQTQLTTQEIMLRELKEQMLQHNADLATMKTRVEKDVICISRRFALVESAEIISGVTRALESLTGGHRVTSDLLPPHEIVRL